MAKSYALCFDIGASFVKYAVFDCAENMIINDRFPTGTGAKNIKSESKVLYEGLKERYPIKSVGVASAGIIDYDSQKVSYAANINGLHDLDFKRLFSGADFVIENDCVAAAMGEAKYGSANGLDSFAYISLGSAIGCCNYFRDRKIGHDYFRSLELSHTIIVHDGKTCQCGGRGCLQAYASSSAIESDYSYYSGIHMSVDRIFALADRDPEAAKAISIYVEYLSAGIVNLIHMTDPKNIILGGGLMDTGYDLLSQIKDKLRHKVLKDYELNLKKASLGNKAALYGLLHKLGRSYHE